MLFNATGIRLAHIQNHLRSACWTRLLSADFSAIWPEHELNWQHVKTLIPGCGSSRRDRRTTAFQTAVSKTRDRSEVKPISQHAPLRRKPVNANFQQLEYRAPDKNMFTFVRLAYDFMKGQ